MTNAPTNKELNKRIHEILGICWHEKRISKREWENCHGGYIEVDYCEDCYMPYYSAVQNRMDFTTSWTSFGILIEWILSRQGSESFLHHINKEYGHDTRVMPLQYLSPLALAEATVNFFKEG